MDINKVIVIIITDKKKMTMPIKVLSNIQCYRTVIFVIMMRMKTTKIIIITMWILIKS